MKKRPFLAISGGFVIWLCLISFLRYHASRTPRPHWEEEKHTGVETGQRRTLEVAFLPVTCHLTCPVTDYASKTSTSGTRFDALRFTEFPSIVEALKSKKLLAGFVTVPLAIKMVEQGAPVKMVCLGHRDGSQLVVAKGLRGTSLRDLRGKTIAIPSPFSNENFFVNKLMRDQGVAPTDIKFVVLPPPDMNAALGAGAIDGFIVAEPFCGKAEMDGIGRVLYYAKDIWPNYISCCLVVHSDLIRESPDVVQDLVRGIVESGEWVEQNRQDAAKLTAPYMKQNEKLMNFILSQPADRVTYRNLNPTDGEIQKIMDMGMSLGFIKKAVPVNAVLDRAFIPRSISPARVDMTRMNELVKPLGATK